MKPYSKSHKRTARFRWAIVPATLAALFGLLLFLANCIHIHDVMMREIYNAWSVGRIIRAVGYALFSTSIMVSSLMAFFAAYLCVRKDSQLAAYVFFIGVPGGLFYAGYFWMSTK